jgi:tetratricopeptide (TPR) repeat protein
MRKILILTLLILLFAHPSAQARKNMKIRSEKPRADSGQAKADDAKPDGTEISEFDYEALALLSLELNPKENSDLVISLLNPYKNDENNKSFNFYSSLGLAFKNTEDFKEAIAAYDRALEIEPNEPSTQYYLGITYYKKNDLPNALKYILKSSEQKPDHPGVIKWIDKLAKELDICKVPDTSNMKMVLDKNIDVNREEEDEETRLRIYFTPAGGRIQVLSVNDKIYSYGIDSDTEQPVDYIIIDTDGDEQFEKVINSRGRFGVPAWAYTPVKQQDAPPAKIEEED